MGLLDLVSVPPGSERKLAKMYLLPLDANSGAPLDRQSDNRNMKSMRLQYWPETMNYARGNVGWQPRLVPGLSHNLMSWSGNGSPTLSFEVILVNEKDPAYEPRNSKSNSREQDQYSRSVNISAGLSWFGAASNPDYSGAVVQPPPVIQMVTEFIAPDGSQSAKSIFDAIGINSSLTVKSPDSDQASDISQGLNLSLIQRDFYGVMTDFSINYEKFYPSGAPRVAVVSLTLMEVIQIGSQILPHSRTDNLQIAKSFDLLQGVPVQSRLTSGVYQG